MMRKQHILIVDDDPEIGALLSEYLHKYDNDQINLEMIHHNYITLQVLEIDPQQFLLVIYYAMAIQ